MNNVKLISDLLATDLASFNYVLRIVTPVLDEATLRKISSLRAAGQNAEMTLIDALKHVDVGELDRIVANSDLEELGSYISTYRG